LIRTGIVYRSSLAVCADAGHALEQRGIPNSNGAENMRHIILHYHILKNAGSTFVSTLRRNFGDNFATFDSPRYDQLLRPEALVEFVKERPNIVAISSHHFFPPVPEMEGIQFHEVLILRNPLDRLRSMYDFFRRMQATENPLTVEAKRLTLPAFLELLIQIRPNLVTNAQVNAIVNRGGRFPDQGDADRALRFLRSVAAVGVVEAFDVFALSAEHSLRAVFPGCDFSYVPENISPRRQGDLQSRLRQLANECGQDLYQKIVSLNQYDTNLVEAAAAESLRRSREIAFSSFHVRELQTRVIRQKLLSRITNNQSRLQRLWKRATRIISKPVSSHTSIR
jgi:hypothetical protein